MLHIGRPVSGRQRKIDKVKPILNILLTKFQSSYDMGCNISIDETMVGFRGRCAAKQYMPKKPQKWGIKAFTLADSSTGYTSNILMYMGSETLEGASSTFFHLLQPARVVMELMEPYLGRGHHLFTDRQYTSVQMGSL